MTAAVVIADLGWEDVFGALGGGLFGPAKAAWDLLRAGTDAAVGWTWDAVMHGLYGWIAHGVQELIVWTWDQLDTQTTPQLSAAWFRDGVAKPVLAIAVSVALLMMFLSAAEAALAGRPEQILDTVKQAVVALAMSVFTIVFINLLLQITDEASASVFDSQRPQLEQMIESLITGTAVKGMAETFVSCLVLLFLIVAVIGLVITFFVRGALLYLVAALAPVAFASSILPVFRVSSRKVIHAGIALVISKLAIVVTLAVSIQVMALSDPLDRPATVTPMTAMGHLLMGATVFGLAALSPTIVYRMLPAAEMAIARSGAGQSSMSAGMTVANSAMMAGRFLGASPATRSVGGATPGAGGEAAAGAGAGAAGGEAAAAGAGAATVATGGLAAPLAAGVVVAQTAAEMAGDAADQAGDAGDALTGGTGASAGAGPDPAGGEGGGGPGPAGGADAPPPADAGPGSNGRVSNGAGDSKGKGPRGSGPGVREFVSSTEDGEDG